jgi:O-antigen/teichoic acid export membrane protein
MRRRLADQLQPLVLMALRIGSMAAKFLLALYTARYLGLADLGIYGLLVGAATMVPWALGLGITVWTMRQIAVMPRGEAAACVTTRLALTLVLHLVGQPIAFALNASLGAPIPWPVAFAGGAILLLEHLACDASDLLLARGRALFGAVLLFVRAGLWPFAVIAWGLASPAARTLDVLLIGWLAGLTTTAIALAVYLLIDERWRALALRPRWMIGGIRQSVPLYIKDLAGSLNLYLDRFLISLFLGLEATGVYTLFWSVANVVHNLSVASLVQPRLPQLIEGARRGPDAFRTIERKLQREVLVWTALLAIGAAVVLPLILPWLGRPQLQANLAVFWLVLAATTLRIGADSYGFALLALHRDSAIAVISVSGVIASALLNAALVPVFGLKGAGYAFVLTALGLFAVRFWVARTWPEHGALKVASQPGVR